MSCDICGRSSCMASFHSIKEQDRYEDVIRLFELARKKREEIRNEEEEKED